MNKRSSHSDSVLSSRVPWRGDQRPHSTNPSPVLRRDQLLPPSMLSRGVEDVSAPTSTVFHPSPSPPLLRNVSPTAINESRPVATTGQDKEVSGVLLLNGHIVNPPVAQRATSIPSGHIDPPVPVRTVHYPPSANYSNIQHSRQYNQEHAIVSKFSKLNTADPTSANPDVSHIPPMESKGRFSCPRCGRRFSKKNECDDHKIRCLI